MSKSPLLKIKYPLLPQKTMFITPLHSINIPAVYSGGQVHAAGQPVAELMKSLTIKMIFLKLIWRNDAEPTQSACFR